jgi:hypothetical protein
LLDAKTSHDYNFLVNTAKIKLKFPTNNSSPRHQGMRGVAQGERPVSQPGGSPPGEISIGTH